MLIEKMNEKEQKVGDSSSESSIDMDNNDLNAVIGEDSEDEEDMKTH